LTVVTCQQQSTVDSSRAASIGDNQQ
jgi:hypothetical protein